MYNPVDNAVEFLTLPPRGISCGDRLHLLGGFMNGAAYDTCTALSLVGYIVVPSELHTLECDDERAKAKI